jgi:hypothetical protein
MINRFGTDCGVFVVFDGTGVVDLELLSVIVFDSKEALGVTCADESDKEFASVSDPGKGCVVEVDSRECRLGFTVNEDPVGG